MPRKIQSQRDSPASLLRSSARGSASGRCVKYRMASENEGQHRLEPPPDEHPRDETHPIQDTTRPAGRVNKSGPRAARIRAGSRPGKGSLGSSERVARDGHPGSSGDLRDHRRGARHLGERRDPPGEERADDGLVAEDLPHPEPAARVQVGEPRRGAGAAGRAIEARGRDHDRVAELGVGPPRRLVELHVEEPARGGHRGMDQRHARLDGEADPLADLHETARLLRLEGEPARRRFHQRVEVAAVGQVECHAAQPRHVDVEVEPHRERGHVADRDRGRLPRSARHPARHQAGGRVEGHGGVAARRGHAAGLHQHGAERDGAVPAHVHRAERLDEEHADVGPRRHRVGQDRAAHGGVAARLVEGHAEQVAAVRGQVLALLHREAPGRRGTPSTMNRIGSPSVW